MLWIMLLAITAFAEFVQVVKTSGKEIIRESDEGEIFASSILELYRRSLDDSTFHLSKQKIKHELVLIRGAQFHTENGISEILSVNLLLIALNSNLNCTNSVYLNYLTFNCTIFYYVFSR